MGAWCFSFTINTKMYLTYKIQSIATHIVLAGHFSSSVGIIGVYNGWNSIFPVLSHGLGSVEHSTGSVKRELDPRLLCAVCINYKD